LRRLGVEAETVTGILDIGGIIRARRGDRMHPATGRTAVDQGRQDKGGTATLTLGRQAAIRENPAAQRATMGLRDKLHQFTPFGKRSTGAMPVPMTMTASTTCTSTHIVTPLKNFYLLIDRGYRAFTNKSLTWVKKFTIAIKASGDSIETTCLQSGQSDP
jgi:hypothetical protein